jgi:predicted TIM-barrel fold metal-dependent hydrolase
MNLISEVNESIIEYGTDTTRTINSLVFTGSSTRYPNIRWIFSHAGGTMPFLIERMVNLAKLPHVAAKLPNGLMHELKRFYYDTAQASNGVALGALKAVAGASQIVFGTDYPYRLSIEHVEGVAGAGLTKDEMIGIDHRNALRLLPNLAKLVKA